MDKRKIKREACWLAYGLLQDHMVSLGWPRTPSHEEDYTEAEFDQLDVALNELLDELMRRGHA